MAPQKQNAQESDSRRADGVACGTCKILFLPSIRRKNFTRDTEKKIIMRKFLTDALGWGVILWLIGYLLGILLFPVVPQSLLGWVIMPIGVLITLWVLLKRVGSDSFQYYVLMAAVWVLIAIICDYFFLVQLFKPADGYYKLDVYLYYSLTFLLPLLIGWKKTEKH